MRIVFGTKLFSHGKENRSAQRFRNQIVLLWETEQKRKSFSEQNCSVIGKKTEVRRVFGTKLFFYEKENRSAKRFGNKIVLLWEREEKCEAISKQNCFVMRKRTEVWIVFGTKLFCYRKEKKNCETFSKRNCCLMGKSTGVEIIFGTKLFCYEKQNRRGNRFGNKIVLL